MQGQCFLCGFDGEINSVTKRPDLYICLMCYIRFYAEKGNMVDTKGEEEMGWESVSGTSSGGKNPDILTISPNTAKLVHILLPDNEEPVSYWTHYIPNKSPNGPKGKVIICPGKDICPACANGTFKTKRVHAINVWDYESKGVKILEGGNTIFQALKQIKDQIGTLLTVDISIKKISSGKDTSYSTIPIPMMGPFDASGVRGLFPIINLRIPNTPDEIEKIINNMEGGNTTTEIGRPVTTVEMHQPPTSTIQVTTPNQTEPLLQFGKYKGRTVRDVYKEDANYIKWCAENISDPTIKAAAKEVISTPTQTVNKGGGVISDASMKQVLINEVNEIFQMDIRYAGKFGLIIEKMKAASVSATYPNGKTILTEYTIEELNKLIASIK